MLENYREPIRPPNELVGSPLVDCANRPLVKRLPIRSPGAGYAEIK